MAASPNFTTVLTFSTIVFALAVTAALLPSSGEKKDIRDLKIEHEIETKSPTYFEAGEKNIFDFLRFQLNPVEVEPRGEITRSRQPSSKKIMIVKQPESPPVRSPQKFVVKVQDNTIGILEKLINFIKQEHEIRYEAIRAGNIEDCATIENARAEMGCRGEIYFQKAIIENNSELCDKIENKELYLRCQKYFQ